MVDKATLNIKSFKRAYTSSSTILLIEFTTVKEIAYSQYGSLILVSGFIPMGSATSVESTPSGYVNNLGTQFSPGVGHVLLTKPIKTIPKGTTIKIKGTFTK